MTTAQKLKNKGYKIVFNLANVGGTQKIISVTAYKNNFKTTKKNITQLYQTLKN